MGADRERGLEQRDGALLDPPPQVQEQEVGAQGSPAPPAVGLRMGAPPPSSEATETPGPSAPPIQALGSSGGALGSSGRSNKRAQRRP